MVRASLMTTIAFLNLIFVSCNSLVFPNAQVENETMRTMETFRPIPIHHDSNSYKPIKDSDAPDSIKQPTISEEQEMIEGIVYELADVEPGMVIIVGNQAWVNIMFDNNLPVEERERIVIDLEKRLYQANPKYEYQIIVNEYMHADKKIREP